MGYSVGKDVKSFSDTCGKLLKKVEDSVDKDIADIKKGLAGAENLVELLSTAVNKTSEKLRAGIASNKAFVDKAKKCAQDGKAVILVKGSFHLDGMHNVFCTYVAMPVAV